MAKDKQPAHYTESNTRKYQTNGPVAWGALFRKVAGRDGREGEGIRAALAFAYERADQFATWADSHPLVMEGQRGGKQAKPAKPAKAKPAKAKPAKAKPAKAKPEQQKLPEVG